jgi:fatty acid desaturase
LANIFEPLINFIQEAAVSTQAIPSKSLLSDLSKNTKHEINQLSRGNIIYIFLLYGHFALAIAGYLPLWTFCIAAPMYVSRWMIGLHEFLHVVKPEDANLFIRLQLLLVTPFSLGYREIREIHLRHHAYAVTERDPDLYLFRGGMITSFLYAVASPEISVYHWIRDKGVDQQLVLGMLVRLILFSLFVWNLGWLSLWYFIPVRLAYGSSMFSISFPLHRKDGAYGTFTPRFGMGERLMQLYCGRAALHTLLYHDIHHDYPRISALKLPAARLHYTPKPLHNKALSGAVS